MQMGLIRDDCECKTLAMNIYECDVCSNCVCLSSISSQFLSILPLLSCFKLLVLSHVPGNITCHFPDHRNIFFRVSVAKL